VLDRVLGGDDHEGLLEPVGGPSTVTWRSSMHSRRADCVFGDARLISSPRSRFVNTEPGRNSNSSRPRFQTVTPTTSEGSRSGVNWMRPHRQSSEVARALARLVLPTPGTSSIRRWPSATRQSRTSSTTSDFPCTTLETLPAMAAKVSANSAGGVALACCVATVLRPSRRPDQIGSGVRQCPRPVGPTASRRLVAEVVSQGPRCEAPARSACRRRTTGDPTGPPWQRRRLRRGRGRPGVPSAGGAGARGRRRRHEAGSRRRRRAGTLLGRAQVATPTGPRRGPRPSTGRWPR
jgi:hypothetical protein